jgi:hypothetical protein
MKAPSRGYLTMTLALMVVLPVVSIALTWTGRARGGHWEVIGKWFVFWAVGVRLFTAGLKQSLQPAFTAKDIFEIEDKGSHVIVRELGLANVSMGLGAVASAFAPSWRPAAAFIGGLYFGLAGLTHVGRRPKTGNELTALVSDLFVFSVATLYLIARAL